MKIDSHVSTVRKNGKKPNCRNSECAAINSKNNDENILLYSNREILGLQNK